MSKAVRAPTTAALMLATMMGAHAQGKDKDDVTGNFYLPYCRSFLEEALVVPTPMQTMNEGMCAGVVYSIRVVAPFLSPNMRSCPPDATTLKQAMRVTISFIERNPQWLNLQLTVLATMALRDTWPCP
jgi:Rap1a immunity proteins